MDTTATASEATPVSVPPPEPKREIVLVRRADLRNRVWTGFLYGIGFWLGSIIGASVFSIFVMIVFAILSAIGIGGLGLLGAAASGA